MQSFPRFLVIVCLSLVLFWGRGVEVLAGSPYKAINVERGCSIKGMVRLIGNAKILPVMEMTKDLNVCGKTKPTPRLVLGKQGGVQNTIICLEGIEKGKPFAKNSTITLDQRKCEYSPHVIIVPFGSAMAIVNDDPILHNVHAYDAQISGKTLFNIAQPVKGQRTVIKETQFKKPGLYVVTCDAGHPWMSGYIMVAEHPYYAVTDVNGNYTLDNVPPGSYTIKMWHEGVSVVNTVMESGKPKSYKYEEPYEVLKEVTVSEGNSVNVDFDLTLR